MVSAGIGVPGVLRQGVLGDYPGALVGAVAASVLIVAAAVLWSRLAGPVPGSSPTVSQRP